MSKSTQPAEVEPLEGPRAFSVFIQDLGNGDAHRHLSEELQRVVRVMQEQAHAQQAKVGGELKLTLKFTTDPSEIVDITYDITTKKPKPRRPRTLMWATDGGNLSRKNPHQRELPLREVEGGRGTARDIGDDAPAMEADQ